MEVVANIYSITERNHSVYPRARIGKTGVGGNLATGFLHGEHVENADKHGIYK
jgi:hypothetical protein